MARVPEIAPGLPLPVDEVRLSASRSSGPGGQHANVTASRVEAAWDAAASPALTEAQRARVLGRLGATVRAVAQDTRGQARNRELALERLAAKVAGALVVPRSRRPSRPSRSAERRRREAKRRQAERKQARRPPDVAGG